MSKKRIGKKKAVVQLLDQVAVLIHAAVEEGLIDPKEVKRSVKAALRKKMRDIDFPYLPEWLERYFERWMIDGIVDWLWAAVSEGRLDVLPLMEEDE